MHIAAWFSARVSALIPGTHSPLSLTHGRLNPPWGPWWMECPDPLLPAVITHTADPVCPLPEGLHATQSAGWGPGVHVTQALSWHPPPLPSWPPSCSPSQLWASLSPPDQARSGCLGPGAGEDWDVYTEPQGDQVREGALPLCAWSPDTAGEGLLTSGPLAAGRYRWGGGPRAC